MCLLDSASQVELRITIVASGRRCSSTPALSKFRFPPDSSKCHPFCLSSSVIVVASPSPAVLARVLLRRRPRPPPLQRRLLQRTSRTPPSSRRTDRRVPNRHLETQLRPSHHTSKLWLVYLCLRGFTIRCSIPNYGRVGAKHRCPCIALWNHVRVRCISYNIMYRPVLCCKSCRIAL